MAAMSAVKILSVIAACLVCALRAEREGYCLTSDYDPYLMFGAKTAYEFINKGKDGSQHIVPYCRAVQFWSFNRHGVTLPDAKEIEELSVLGNIRDEVIANYEIRHTAPDQGRLCQNDIQNLKAWYWNRNYTVQFAGDLTYQGYDDLRYLARRWQSKFPQLLPTTYVPRDFQFRYTDTRRTKESFRAFVEGLFGRDASNTIHAIEPTQKDTLLKAYSACDAWTKINDDPNTEQQLKLFKMKEEYQTMIQNVSSKLGYRYPLSEDKVKNIYDMCRYDKAWEVQKNSPWCAAFSKDNLQLLEYAEDLDYYYRSGYGLDINKKVGCTLVKDMYDHFAKMVENPEAAQPKVMAYFSNSVPLLQLLVALGAARDQQPLTSDNLHLPAGMRRAWRTSRIDPFAANLVAVLYSCDQGDKNRVMFFLNEKPIDFEGCSVGLCSWDFVKSKYGPQAQSCSLDFCAGSTATSNMAIGLISTLILAITSNWILH